ncbi:putative transferase [Helianthus debilis subsp. tardiflorus]
MEMIPVEEALTTVLDVSRRLSPVTVAVQDALCKVLAEDIRPPDPLPPYPASIKDGYAVIAADGPGEYPVITESRAGNDGLGVTVTPGTIAYVTTGGMQKLERDRGLVRFLYLFIWFNFRYKFCSRTTYL